MNHFIMLPLVFSVAAGALISQETPREIGATKADRKSDQQDVARYRASELIGRAISNPKNEDMGEIQDIVMDSANRRISYAVVAFGGFLGMGEKYIALPWQLLDVEQRSEDDEIRITLGLDPEVLKAAPGFDKDKWPDLANESWTTKVDDYYRRIDKSGEPTRDRPGGVRGDKPGGDRPGGVRSGGDRPEGVAPGQHDKRGEGTVGRAQSDAQAKNRRLTKFIGMEVVDAKHDNLAEVEDLVVDAKKATVDGAMLSFGGTLGIGEKMVLLPVDALVLDAKGDVYVLTTNRAGLESMALAGGKMPPLNNDDWLKRGNEFCAKEREKGAQGGATTIDASGKKPTEFTDEYDVDQVETVNGTITSLGAVNVGKQGEERVRLRVRTEDGREMIVYAAPESFEAQRALDLRRGTKIEVTGSQTKHNNRTVLNAGSLVVDGETVKLRDEKGQARWSKK